MSENKSLSELKKLAKEFADEVDRIGVENCWWTNVHRGQPDKSQPLSKGDWVKDKKEKSLYIILEISIDGRVDVISSSGHIFKDCPLSNFHQITLEEADLPKCPKCGRQLKLGHASKEHGDRDFYWADCPNPNINCYSSPDELSKHDAIAFALEDSIGHKLFDQAIGGSDGK